MRKIATAIAAAATLGLMAFTAPAFADDNGYRGNNQYNNNQHNDDSGYQDRGDWNNRGRDVDRRFDSGRHERGFDRWERGWGHDGFGDYRNHGKLSYWRLIRRIEAQGYYRVRGLRQSRHGWGLRAFAFSYRGQPVMLRINPYTGRVMNVRHLYASYSH